MQHFNRKESKNCETQLNLCYKYQLKVSILNYAIDYKIQDEWT